MYEIYLERAAEKDLKKLPTNVLNPVINKIKALANNPHPRRSKKLIDSESFYRIRIGSYRVIYEVIESSRIIRIYKIKHRKDIYK